MGNASLLKQIYSATKQYIKSMVSTFLAYNRKTFPSCREVQRFLLRSNIKLLSSWLVRQFLSKSSLPQNNTSNLWEAFPLLNWKHFPSCSETQRFLSHSTIKNSSWEALPFWRKFILLQSNTSTPWKTLNGKHFPSCSELQRFLLYSNIPIFHLKKYFPFEANVFG